MREKRGKARTIVLLLLFLIVFLVLIYGGYFYKLMEKEKVELDEDLGLGEEPDIGEVTDSEEPEVVEDVSEESEGKHSRREIWESTISTFFYKFVFSLSFVVPFLIFSLANAVAVSILWGLILLNTFSYLLAKGQRKRHVWKVVAEHFFIAIIVIVATKILGEVVGKIFI